MEKKTVKQFLDISSIHGLRYTSGGSSRRSEKYWKLNFRDLKNIFEKSISRIFWTVALILSSFMFGLLMYETTEKFVSDQIVIKLSENRHSIAEVPFPAITFCSECVDTKKMLSKEIHEKLKLMNLTIEKWDFHRIFIELTLASKFSISFDYAKLENLLHDTNMLHHFNFQSVLDLLDLETQDHWYNRLFRLTWRSRIPAPNVVVLTKWGYCITFNMMPAAKLFNLEKWDSTF
jgi:Amiloride-sensitive sodium channel